MLLSFLLIATLPNFSFAIVDFYQVFEDCPSALQVLFVLIAKFHIQLEYQQWMYWIKKANLRYGHFTVVEMLHKQVRRLIKRKMSAL